MASAVKAEATAADALALLICCGVADVDELAAAEAVALWTIRPAEIVDDAEDAEAEALCSTPPAAVVEELDAAEASACCTRIESALVELVAVAEASLCATRTAALDVAEVDPALASPCSTDCPAAVAPAVEDPEMVPDRTTGSGCSAIVRKAAVLLLALVTAVVPVDPAVALPPSSRARPPPAPAMTVWSKRSVMLVRLALVTVPMFVVDAESRSLPMARTISVLATVVVTAGRVHEVDALACTPPAVTLNGAVDRTPR